MVRYNHCACCTTVGVPDGANDARWAPWVLPAAVGVDDDVEMGDAPQPPGDIDLRQIMAHLRLRDGAA